jgi:hypothetical protein
MAQISPLTFPSGIALSSAEKAIINNRNKKDGTVTAPVPTLETLEGVYGNTLPKGTESFDSYIKQLQSKALANVAAANIYLSGIGDPDHAIKPSGAAFNNCNGAWSEYGYSVFAWNSLAKINRANRVNFKDEAFDAYVYIKLPNRNSESNDWLRLLTIDIQNSMAGFPTTYGKKITDTTSSNFGRKFELISSNPDAVILKFDSHRLAELWATTGITKFDPYSDIDSLDKATAKALDSLFNKFVNSVLPSKNLQCFLSIKRSTRPDRRYQWVLEGDHVKRILQWIMAESNVFSLDQSLETKDLNGKFFAISLQKVSKTDRVALDAGLVDPGLSVNKPVWAVDKLFECNYFSDINSEIVEMLQFK